ncbi:hypothetical protein HDV00_008831 [Rhizophlyctis rosea]|nr:hypothetical protein HDV00_008831 [Rhizophlyctis rosea]
MKKLQDQIDKYQTDTRMQQLTLAQAEKDRDDAVRENRALRDTHTTEKDTLNSSLISLRKKHEVAQSECARLQLSYDRCASEKQAALAEKARVEEEMMKYKAQVEEQLQLNERMKGRCEELRGVNLQLQTQIETLQIALDASSSTSLGTRVKELEAEVLTLRTDVKQAETRCKQEEHLRMKIAEDCSELVKSNVSLKKEVEDVAGRLRKELASREAKVTKRQDQLKELENVKAELDRLKDDFGMLRISADAKDRKIGELTSQIKTQEAGVNKAIEARTVMAERITELEERVRQQELEIIQLGQDKSLLIDDVAELRNTTDLRTHKLSNLTSENHQLRLELERFQKQLSARGEFSSLLREVENSGENYLSLMRNVRMFLKGDDGDEGGGTGSGGGGGGEEGGGRPASRASARDL